MPFKALIAAGAIALGLAVQPAMAANICKAGALSCATTMPVGGYCQCTARGQTEDGTVAAGRPAARRPVNSTAGGCGANPTAPGCRS